MFCSLSPTYFLQHARRIATRLAWHADVNHHLISESCRCGWSSCVSWMVFSQFREILDEGFPDCLMTSFLPLKLSSLVQDNERYPPPRLDLPGLWRTALGGWWIWERFCLSMGGLLMSPTSRCNGSICDSITEGAGLVSPVLATLTSLRDFTGC